jgi:hypothetical protein
MLRKRHSVVLFICLSITRVGLGAETNSLGTIGKLFPQQISGYLLAKDVRDWITVLPTSELQFAYLAGVLTNATTPATNDVDRKTTAILLLGLVGNTNSIDLLATQIAFKGGNAGHSYPGVFAFSQIGEPAIPKLLDVIRNSTNEVVIANAVKSLVIIKGTNYGQFVLTQKTNLLQIDWKKLIDHAVWD